MLYKTIYTHIVELMIPPDCSGDVREGIYGTSWFRPLRVERLQEPALWDCRY